jgi:hypothetical protein
MIDLMDIRVELEKLMYVLSPADDLPNESFSRGERGIRPSNTSGHLERTQESYVERSREEGVMHGIISSIHSVFESTEVSEVMRTKILE